MVAHIEHAVNYWIDAWENIRDGRASENRGLRYRERSGAHCNWDYLTSIEVELDVKRGVEKEVTKGRG